MTLAPRTRLGPFEVVSQLGAGGMGEVYRARDTRLDRTVAIKVLTELPAPSTGPTPIERFRSEARAIARISHPNICTLHDVGQEGSVTFLVMEYVEGVTLARRLEEGRLPVHVALDVAIQIADALDHAHRQGVVHRDLKPGNVMIAQNRVKLLDFGLAKIIRTDDVTATAVTQAAVVTEKGTMAGTPAYMAPEQIEGGKIDERTDIFSFGVVLYEMLAGRRPFAADTRAGVLSAIVSQDPTPLSEHAPLASSSLARLVARCLAKNPDDRWQTARDLAAALRWIVEERTEVSAKWATARRPRHFGFGLLAGAVLAGLIGLVVTALMRPRATSVLHEPVTFRRGAVSSARFTPDGQNIVYSASWEGQPYQIFLGQALTADVRLLELEGGRIMSISASGEMAAIFGPQNMIRPFGTRTLARIPLAGGGRRDLLKGVDEADWIPGSDELAVVRIRENDRTAVVEFPIGTSVHEAPAIWSLRVSPDGKQVAFFEGPARFDGTATGMITVVSRTGGKYTLSRNWTGLGLAWAPSSQEIWFTATKGDRAPALNAVSLSGRERPVYAAPDWLVVHDIAPDGRVLLARNTIDIGISCQAPGESVERDLTWLFGSTVRDISADGQTIVFAEILGGAGGASAILRRSIRGGPAVQIGHGNAFALSPDGDWVLANTERGLALLPTGAGSPKPLPKGEVEDTFRGGWLPDGKRVVFGASRGGVNRGYVQSIDGGPPRALTPPRTGIAMNAATPDGAFVLGRSGGQWSLYPVDGGAPRAVTALTGADTPLRWGSDGKSLFVITRKEPPITSMDVFRVDVATGHRELWKTLAPRDSVGIDDVTPVVVAANGTAYCYSSVRRLGRLFVTTGLR